MSNTTGSVTVGDYFSIAWNYNDSTSNPALFLTLSYMEVTVGSATLTAADASAKFGGSISGTDMTADATGTANWSTNTLSYTLEVVTLLPYSKKTYSGSTTF